MSSIKLKTRIEKVPFEKNVYRYSVPNFEESDAFHQWIKAAGEKCRDDGGKVWVDPMLESFFLLRWS